MKINEFMPGLTIIFLFFISVGHDAQVRGSDGKDIKVTAYKEMGKIAVEFSNAEAVEFESALARIEAFQISDKKSDHSRESSVFHRLAKVVSEIALTSEFFSYFMPDEGFAAVALLDVAFPEGSVVAHRQPPLDRLDESVMLLLNEHFSKDVVFVVDSMVEQERKFRAEIAEDVMEVFFNLDFDKINSVDGKDLVIAISFAMEKVRRDYRVISPEYPRAQRNLAESFARAMSQDKAQSILDQFGLEKMKFEKDPEGIKQVNSLRID